MNLRNTLETLENVMNRFPLANEEYYHVYNRGVDKRDIFCDERDYARFFQALLLMNDEQDGLMIQWRNCKMSNPVLRVDDFLKNSLSNRRKLVDIVAYCLNSNHYHFVLKQVRDKGIERFMHRIATGYTMYFNKKYHRTGSLFQGRFKATHINNNDLLLHLIAYVNCNCEIHRIAKAKNYKWCSYPDYLGKKSGNLLSKKIISDQFKDKEYFRQFSESYVEHFKDRKSDEKIFLE